MLTSAASSNFESEEMRVFCFACHKCHGHPASDHQRRPPRNKPFSSAIRNCILKASAETGLTRAACALHRGHSPDLSSFGRCGSPCHTSKFGPQNRLKCRPSIMTHRVAENETSHSVSAVSPTGNRALVSTDLKPMAWSRATEHCVARPRENLRRFQSVVLHGTSPTFALQYRSTEQGRVEAVDWRGWSGPRPRIAQADVR
jgi:hypothetical protein